jgi:putative nucleotide binding protein
MTDEQESGVSAEASADSEAEAIVLDYLARGDSDADRRLYRQSPVAFAVRPADFALFAVALADDAHVSIGDRIVVDGPNVHPDIEDARRVSHDELSGGAESELEYVVEEIIEADEERFVDFFNDAQPISLRLHQLNLLPGIGKKLRNNILDERKRRPFDSFEDVEERVSGLHDPKRVLIDRVLEELRQTDLKYRNFVDTPPE